MPEFKPYLEANEEVLRIIHIRTDREALTMIRDGLFALASDTDGLNEEVEGVANRARQAEELLVMLPGATSSGRRSPEVRLRETIAKARLAREESNQEQERLSAILAVVEKELPDVVAAARERVADMYAADPGDTVEPPGGAPGEDPTVETVDETAQATPIVEQPPAVAQP